MEQSRPVLRYPLRRRGVGQLQGRALLMPAILVGLVGLWAFWAYKTTERRSAYAGEWEL